MIDELESGILLVACSRQLSPQLPHSHLSAHIKCPRTFVPGCTKNQKTQALRFARQFSLRLKVNFRGAVQQLADLVSES